MSTLCSQLFSIVISRVHDFIVLFRLSCQIIINNNFKVSTKKYEESWKSQTSLWFCLLLFLKVILGGGRMYMTPKGTPDPEYPTSNSRKGDRKDKRNLIDVWLKAKPVGLLTIIVQIFPQFPHDSSQSHVSSGLCFRTRNHAMFGTGRSLMR